MSDKEDLLAALEQMKYEVVDNGTMDLPVSHPAHFTFESPATLERGAFESALEERGFNSHGTVQRESEDGFYFKTRVITDHYKDCVVKVWNDETRIFPRDEHPDRYELSRIVHAIEEAFGSELSHVEDIE